MRTNISRSSESPKNAVIVLLCLVILAGWSPVAKAQQKSASTDVYVGILVTATSAEADILLKELRAGMDFGVLAKEMLFGWLALNPEDALKSAMGGRFGDPADAVLSIARCLDVDASFVPRANLIHSSQIFF